MSDVNTLIRERIEAFVEEISDMVRQAALDSVAEALGGSEADSLIGSRRPHALEARRAFDPRRGGKRSSDQIDATTNEVIAFVQQNPGQGVEQIAKSLGTDTRQLTLPIKKLIAEGQLVTEGQKRATKYFAAEAEAEIDADADTDTDARPLVIRRPRSAKSRRAHGRRSRS